MSKSIHQSLQEGAVKTALRDKYGVFPPQRHIAAYVQAINAVAGKTPEGREYQKHLGGFTGDSLTQSHVDNAAQVLVHSGLVERANSLMRLHTPRLGIDPLPEALPNREPPRGLPSGFVEVPKWKPRPAEVPVGEKLAETFPGKPKLANDDAPLPLADVAMAKQERSRSHHAIISKLIGQRRPVAEIAKAVAEAGGIGEGTARRHIRAWLENQRRGLSVAAPPAETPEKLARGPAREPKPKPPIPASVPQKPVSLPQLSQKTIDPHIAGTRLANHLHQILKDTTLPTSPVVKDWVGTAEDSPYSRSGVEGGGFSHSEFAPEANRLADSLLRKKDPNDSYASLGKKLMQMGHPLATKYNWDTMDRSMKEDRFMEGFVRRNVKGASEILDSGDPEKIRKMWEQVLKRYSGDAKESTLWGHRAATGEVSDEAHTKFWDRLAKEFANHPAMAGEGRLGVEYKERLSNAMYRHHALADEREMTAALRRKKDPKVEQFPKRKIKGKAYTTRDWRHLMAESLGNPVMKFRRPPDAGDVVVGHILLKIAELSPRRA